MEDFRHFASVLKAVRVSAELRRSRRAV